MKATKDRAPARLPKNTMTQLSGSSHTLVFLLSVVIPTSTDSLALN